MYSTLNDNPIDLDSPTSWNPFVTYNEYTNNYLDSVNECVEDCFSKESMRQYVYRYLIKQSHTDKENRAIDSEIIDALIKDKCVDGSCDYSYNGNLEKYHKSGVVNKTIVSWKEGKSSYTLYCFFEETVARKFFSKYYGAHNETKTDLIFLLDTKNNKYKIYLYRYGAAEPLEFPNTGYKIIVFKSGFEKYRSENYNMPHGAWAW